MEQSINRRSKRLLPRISPHPLSLQSVIRPPTRSALSHLHSAEKARVLNLDYRKRVFHLQRHPQQQQSPRMTSQVSRMTSKREVKATRRTPAIARMTSRESILDVLPQLRESESSHRLEAELVQRSRRGGWEAMAAESMGTGDR